MTQKFHQPDPQACDDFQQQLPELIGAGQPLGSHPHAQSCELCSALIRDLEAIAEAARQLLPVEQPKDDLWDRINSAIQAEESEMGK